MKTILFSLTAAAAALVTSTPAAEAGHCRTGGYHRPVVRQHYIPSHQDYGHQDHMHHQPAYVQPQQQYVTVLPHTVDCFTHQCKLGCGTRGFFSPQHNDWFYFYPQRNCYVPVKYIQQFAPTNLNRNNNTNQNANLNQNRNNNQNVTNINVGPGVLKGVGPGPIAPPPGAGPVSIVGPEAGPHGELVLPLPN